MKIIDFNVNDGANLFINAKIEKDEEEKAIRNLKNNKASGDDAVINEYI